MYMEKAPLPCANVPARGKGAYLVLRSGSRIAGSAQSAFHAVICRACGRFTRMVRLWPGRARTHYPTRGMSPARPRGHGRQSVPLLSASALSRSILLRACQFSEFPKLLLLFWALCRLFALFSLSALGWNDMRKRRLSPDKAAGNDAVRVPRAFLRPDGMHKFDIPRAWPLLQSAAG